MQDMYTVMIVDDEKAIRDSLPVVINLKCMVFAFVRQREMGRMHSKNTAGAPRCTASRYSYANLDGLGL